MYSACLTGEEADECINLAAESAALILSSNLDDDDLKKAHSVNASIQAARLLRYGEVGAVSLHPRRSLPIALSSALLPEFFPHGNLLTFFAAICSGLCYTAIKCGRETPALLRVASTVTGDSEASCSDLLSWIDRITDDHDILTLASLAEGTADMSVLLNKIDANQVLFGYDDGPLSPYIPDIIQFSLNR